jgi:hypothetical protein
MGLKGCAIDTDVGTSPQLRSSFTGLGASTNVVPRRPGLGNLLIVAIRRVAMLRADERMPFDHVARTHALLLALARISPLIPETVRVLLLTGLGARSTKTTGILCSTWTKSVLLMPLTARGLAKGDTAGVMPCNSAPDAINALRN